MAYIVYITVNCKDEAKKHNFEDALLKLKENIEKNQSISQLERFGSTKYSSKKKFGSFQGRLITYEKVYTVKQKEYAVIIFLTLFIRGDKEYSVFQRDPESNGKKYLSKIDDDAIQDYIEISVDKNPLPTKQQLHEDEEAYLHSAGISDYNLDNEDLIYESDEWVRIIKQEPFSLLLPRIYDTVKKIYEKTSDDNEIEIVQRNERIIFSLEKEKKRLSLLNIVNVQDQQQSTKTEKIISDWNEKIDKDISIVKRAYPQYILADETLWMGIEKDPLSNFVLSKEEIEILSSCTRTQDQESAFPLFINGRAGSGKSTMLQYLFTDYFSRYFSYKDTIKNPPIYFTYNADLLQRAKLFVKGLITCNSFFTDKKELQEKNKDFISELEDSFKEFKTYLLSLVPPSDNHWFDKNNYINYTRFKSLWMDKFKTIKNAPKDYNYDICWHVIRTYIQGIDTEEYLDVDDYDELEEKQKTVSKEKFQLIFDKVWLWYDEQKNTKKLWDDRDLVRYIIEHDLAKPLFPGVFCDEAQDFTRIEMEVILRLSLFSNRDIKKQHISKIPFAFAGDELQTLNPTGFRWEALKAGFTQKFILSLSTENTSRVQTNLNYRELKNNYRSSPSIVKFCNTLQLFRYVRFNIPGLQPQIPWNALTNAPVVYFLSNDASFWENIQKLTDTVFIIPCDEGQEIEWIKENKDLKEHIHVSNNTPNVPVLSANLSKGLEFNRVVVYGFGMDCPANTIEKKDNEDISKTLPLEYYINKTYVAISRAKKQLFIVDSQDGIEDLWRVTQDKQLIDKHLEIINDGNTAWSSDNLSFLMQGSHSNLLDDENEINMDDIATQFKESGISSRNSYMLRQAGNIYKELAQTVEANKCEALAYLFDGKYLEAGKTYNASGWIEDAIKSYWLANNEEGYTFIVENKNTKYTLLFDIAHAITSNDKNIIIKAIETLSKTSESIMYEIFKGDAIFQEYEMCSVLELSINKIVEKLLPYINSKEDAIILHRIIDITKQGTKIDNEKIA
ncbi:MAG: ATP-binding domain-containing protein, partial [Bacteroidales bacterium]|nr:ATP-binding domain-containing protein [Bacteroidales bacterium]